MRITWRIVDDLAILSDSLLDLKNRLADWKTSLESHGLRVSVDKTTILVSRAEHIKISARNPECPCGVCTLGVVANSVLCTLWNLWVDNKCSGITDHLTDNRNFVCRKCSSKIIPAAIAWRKLTSGMTVFMLNPPWNILVISWSMWWFWRSLYTYCLLVERIPRIVTYSHQPCNPTKT